MIELIRRKDRLYDENEIGRKISALREGLNIRQDEFADRIGVSRQSLSPNGGENSVRVYMVDPFALIVILFVCCAVCAVLQIVRTALFIADWRGKREKKH